MSEQVFHLGFGDQKISVVLPQEKIAHVIEGRKVEPIQDVKAAALEALRNPIGSEPLDQVVKKGDKVAIIVSDITRAWIKFDQFLPVLLDELNAAGVPDEDMYIVIALGGHRPHIQGEDEAVCGEEVCRRVRIYQHEAFDKTKLVYKGTTTRGTELFINEKVASADKIILTGGIVYHLMAGFGGGRKSIMPGISGYTSIQANHRLCMHQEVGKGINTDCASGKLAGNPMHEDLMEIGEMVNPAFLLNAVFTPDGKFAKFVAGNWQKAWEVGCKEIENIYGIPIKTQADLVIASAGGFPKDINLYQGSKTVDNAFLAVKPGGVMICLMECRDIYEPKEFSGWFEHKDILEFEKALRQNFTIPGFVAFNLTTTARKASVIIVTKPENVDFIKNTGMIPATSIEEALKIAEEKLGNDYTVSIMPKAANTVPILM